MSIFPDFQSLRPTDMLNNEMTSAHYSAYLLLKKLNNITFKTDDGLKNDKNLQIITCESLTAGLLFSTLVNIPAGGSLKYGSFSVYDTDAKRVFCGVEVDDVYTHRCAAQMAVGALQNSNATFSIAVTGNAMPYQHVEQNMKQLGEIFIGIACYGADNKIITKTKVFNVCKNNDPITSTEIDFRTCSLFYNTVEEEIILKKILNDADLHTKVPSVTATEVAKLKDIYNGFNDYETTSFVSNFIRYRTVSKACEFAVEFIDNYKDLIVYPNFITDTKSITLSRVRSAEYTRPNAVFALHGNNSVLNSVSERQNYIPMQLELTASDITRINPVDGDLPKNLYLFKGGGDAVDPIHKRLYKKYKKYKAKYIRSKNKINKVSK